ncbi:MAG: YihY/virulence factor BrkB family protein [Methylibium sp.]|nr:YihY/virulence factor BrkB family protein [Methylibium sp.]
MSRLASVLRWLRDHVPGLHIVVKAVRNYIFHQSGNQAGSVAFSSVLAMFPLLIVLSAAAGFFGEPGAAAELATRVLEFAPPVVFEALRPAVDEVLRPRNRALLVAGVVVTVWAASSGTQAVRTALNRAYGVDKAMSFWAARLKVIFFTLIGASITVLVFSSVVILPYVWDLFEAMGAGKQAVPWLQVGVRYGLAFVVVLMLYASLYGWLPDLRQRLRTVLPGALVGAALWLVAAAGLSYTLRNVGKLALVYGGFAGAAATLVFLYACAATLIFGAEINGVLREQESKPPPSGKTGAQ